MDGVNTPPNGTRLHTVPRPSWDAYFLDMARHVATRATCDRAHVGCVIVADRAVLATGYNGAPSGLPHCDDIGHRMEDGHCTRTVHAEANAIVQAAKHGVRLTGAALYVTHMPCAACTHLVINAGIRRVVFAVAYRDNAYVRDAYKLASISLEGPAHT